MQSKWRFSFRAKLILLILLFSVIPLTGIAVFVDITVQDRYQKTLADFYDKNVELHHEMLTNYLESNKSWIKSITAQDLFLTEVEKYTRGEKVSENRIFASLTSLKRENPFVESIYIIDTTGEIITSTVLNEKGSNIQANNVVFDPEDRSPKYLKIHSNPQGTRVISLTTPFIKKSNSKILGFLVVDINTSAIKSLVEGNLYTSQSIANSKPTELTENYVIDENGNVLTNLSQATKTPLTQTQPYISCKQNQPQKTSYWKNYADIEVYGTYECNQFDDLKLVFVTEQTVKQAFKPITDLRYTIFSITIIVSALLTFVIFKISRSFTMPIKDLKKGAQEYGKGNFDYSIDIHTNDELEDLGHSFSEMASKLNNLIIDLHSRDDSLNTVNGELQNEKETIAAERNKLQVVISGITDAVIALNLNRQIIMFNKAAQDLTGFTEEQALGKPINKILRFVDNKTELSLNDYCPVREDTYEGVIFSKENLHMLCSNNKNAYVKIITGKIREGASVNLACILTIHDMGKEKQFEDMKLDFVSMAAHELRTPITSIRGYASVLQEEIGEVKTDVAAEWTTLLGRISISAEQLLTLVENLLNITKIEKGILSLSLKDHKWKDAIMEVVEVFKDRAKSKSLNLIVQEIPVDLVAYVDLFRVNEVLSNLISNAINYTPNGGTIIVDAKISEDGKWIETSITDNGQGIPKESQGHLFEKFFRVSGPLEQGSKGNGLGLYISKSIVEMHNGKIWVESDQGMGAKFTFTIPKSDSLLE
jgi:two-component system sensor histidine kinase VicK